MGREKVKYSEAELNRPSKYIVAVADPNIDTSIIDIEEAEQYVNKYERRAIIISGKEVFKNAMIEKTKYIFIMNATKPTVRVIDSNGDSFKKVYEYLGGKYLNGLIIAHAETLTNHIANDLAMLSGKGLDFIVYRQDLMDLSGNERGRMNFLRIHYNLDFVFSKNQFSSFTEKYGIQNAIGIYTTQYIVNAQYGIAQNYFQEHSEKFEKEGWEDFIDYYQMNKQFAYFLYYDMKRSKIIGMSGEKIHEYMELMFKAIDNKSLANKAHELCNIFAQ